MAEPAAKRTKTHSHDVRPTLEIESGGIHSGQVIYEVNLEIDKDTEVEYITWLYGHIPVLLSLPGFIKARTYKRKAEDESSESKRALYTVEYVLENRQALQDYFDKHAVRVRGDAAVRFAGKFEAKRRVRSFERFFPLPVKEAEETKHEAALVTGADHGIGLALSRALNEKGTKVYAVVQGAKPQTDLKVAQVITGIDVTDGKAVEKLTAELKDVSLDLLIHTVNTSASSAELGSLTSAGLKSSYESHAVGPLLLCQGLAKSLKKGAKVVIVNNLLDTKLSSETLSYEQELSYNALRTVTRRLAADFKKNEVSVLATNSGTSSAEVVESLLSRVDELTVENSGRLRHYDGRSISSS